MTPATAGAAVRHLVPVMPEAKARPVGDAAGERAGEDWAAVAEALNARMTACRMSQQRLAETSGISVATIRRLQHGAGRRRARDDTLAALSAALGWPDRHLIRVLLGERPAHLADTQPGVGGARTRRSASGTDRREGRPATADAGESELRPDGQGSGRPSLADVAEDLGEVVDLLTDVLDRLANLATAGADVDAQWGNAMPDVENEESVSVYGVVSFADPGRTRALAVYLPFESPAAARAYARRHGLTHSLVSPLVFDTGDSATGNGEDDPGEPSAGLVVARTG